MTESWRALCNQC